MSNKQEYELCIFTKTGKKLVVEKSTNFDEVFVKWKEVKDLWSTSIKEQKPFELTKPIVTAFDPGLIFEITVLPVEETVTAKHSNNPYANQMQKEGLGSMLGSRGMLDQGFNI